MKSNNWAREKSTNLINRWSDCYMNGLRSSWMCSADQKRWNRKTLERNTTKWNQILKIVDFRYRQRSCCSSKHIRLFNTLTLSANCIAYTGKLNNNNVLNWRFFRMCTRSHRDGNTNGAMAVEKLNFINIIGASKCITGERKKNEQFSACK